MDLRTLKVENEHLAKDRDQYKEVFERVSLEGYDWEACEKYESLKQVVEELTLERIINDDFCSDIKLLEIEPKCWRAIHQLIEDIKKINEPSIINEQFVNLNNNAEVLDPTPRF